MPFTTAAASIATTMAPLVYDRGTLGSHFSNGTSASTAQATTGSYYTTAESAHTHIAWEPTDATTTAAMAAHSHTHWEQERFAMRTATGSTMQQSVYRSRNLSAIEVEMMRQQVEQQMYSRAEQQMRRMQSQQHRIYDNGDWWDGVDLDTDSPAELKAQELLKSLIGTKEMDIYKETGRVLVKGKKHTYILRKGKLLQMVEGDKLVDLCVHINTKYQCPQTDNVIALMLELETDEDNVIRLANRMGTESLPEELPLAACM